MSKKLSKIVLYYFFCSMAISLLFLTGENLNSYLSQDRVLGTEVTKQLHRNSELIQEKEYWGKMVSQNPSYFPGFIELVNINLELNDKNSAVANLIKARQINPNSKEVKILEEILKI
jgi:hypothetical protein